MDPLPKKFWLVEEKGDITVVLMARSCVSEVFGLGDFDWLINRLIQSDMAKGQIRRLSLFFSTLQIDTGVNFSSFKVF